MCPTRCSRTTLDSIADGLTELSDAGVPVLFRPLHEMNISTGKAFWWSGRRPAEYTAVYSPLCGSGSRTA